MKMSEEQPNKKCDGCKRVEGLEGEHIYTCNCGVEQPNQNTKDKDEALVRIVNIKTK